MLISGKVIRGHSLGRKLGFPTANIATDSSLGLANGVYRSRVRLGGEWFAAVSNLGTKPSVGGTERLLETHIINFSGDIYDQLIEIELIEKLRDEQLFNTLEELTEQIKKDIEKVKTINKNRCI